MFVTKNGLKRLLNEVLYGSENTNETITKLKEEIADLKLQKKMEEREIKQLVKMKEETNELEFQKKELKLKEEFAEKEQKLLKEYHEKNLKQIDKASKEMKEIYSGIMKRLPNIQASLDLAAQGNKKK